MVNDLPMHAVNLPCKDVEIILSLWSHQSYTWPCVDPDYRYTYDMYHVIHERHLGSDSYYTARSYLNNSHHNNSTSVFLAH